MAQSGRTGAAECAAAIAAGAVFVLTALLFGAWMLRLPGVLTLGTGLPSIKPNAVLGFALGAAALWAAVQRAPPGGASVRGAGEDIAAGQAWRAVQWLGASAMLLIGGVTLLEHLAGIDLGLDQALFSDLPGQAAITIPGRMNRVTALALLLLGAALLLIDWQPRGGRQSPAQWLAVLVLALAFAVLVGYLSGYQTLRRAAPFASMSAHTALCIVGLGIGVLFARPRRGLAGVILESSAGGQALRQLLPAVILLPPALTGVCRLAVQEGWIDAELDRALAAVALVLGMSAITWRCAGSLRRMDRERAAASAALAREVGRLTVLGQITRAIGERQDLRSIFLVVINTIWQLRRAEFACVCIADAAGATLTVACTGPWNESMAVTVGLTEGVRLDAVVEGLGPAMQGRLLRESPATSSALTHRLARGGLSFVAAAPLRVESRVLGVLLVARRDTVLDDNDCQFLEQLAEHMALAAHHAQLYDSLRLAYDELRLSQQAALQQQSLRALGQMASGIAHDINNAISPAALYVEALLEREPALGARARGRLLTIQRAIDDVARTVGRMREFYRQREPALAHVPLDANALMQQVLELTRARWHDMPLERGITLQVITQLATELPPFMGAAGEVRDGLINLLFNAIDALPHGGVITLETALMCGPPPRVALTVRDTGIGMDDETRRRCLEPFYTTKGARGTGLGLAMVYGMIQRHGAELAIETAPGRGTSMRLLFAAAAADLPKASQSTPARPLTPLRILLIDDDTLLVSSLADVLRGEGHEVVTADGGQAGIETFQRAQAAGAVFDAVITDLGMPYVDGRQVAAAIRRENRAVPIVLLTGWGQHLSAQEEVPACVDRMLSKPPRLQDLRVTLAELAGRS